MLHLHRQKSSPENELISRLKNGDSGAFEELFFTYCQPLIQFAHRFVGDVATAEDIVQEVFLKIWSNRQQLNPTLNIKNYLYVSIKNQALKQLRHQKVGRKAFDKLQFYQSRIPTPEELFDSAEIESTVWNTLNELPDKCRLIFSMNRFDKLTYSEIADILNLSVKTIESHMGHALACLRKKLNHLLQLLVTF
jgi:RNA polymerase sigma-70 factor (ECF subfamily)